MGQCEGQMGPLVVASWSMATNSWCAWGVGPSVVAPRWGTGGMFCCERHTFALVARESALLLSDGGQKMFMSSVEKPVLGFKSRRSVSLHGLADGFVGGHIPRSCAYFFFFPLRCHRVRPSRRANADWGNLHGSAGSSLLGKWVAVRCWDVEQTRCNSVNRNRRSGHRREDPVARTGKSRCLRIFRLMAGHR